MHVIGANFRLDDIHLFPTAKRTEYLTDLAAFIPIEHFSPELGDEYDMVLAIPRRVGKGMIIAIFQLNSFGSFVCSWQTAFQ